MPNSPEYTSLRQIMYQPSACWLSTENSGDRWLTDQFVLMNVTGIDAFEVCGECSSGRICGECPPGYPDGPYKLTVSNGPQQREGVPEPDIEAWFTRAAESKWRRAKPTEWSVAEHPGKAMLWAYGSAGGNAPCLFGEPTWTALKRHHPEVIVEYARDLNLFRFSEVDHIDPDGDCHDIGCGCRWLPFCYAAGIRVPDGQQDIACAITALVDSTSNEPLSLGS